MSGQASVPLSIVAGVAGSRYGTAHRARSFVNDVGSARQVNTVQITQQDATAFAFAINGYLITYTSDASGTYAEIRDGLIAAARLIPELEDVCTFNPSGNDIKITAKVAGTGFTYSEPVADSNLATTAVTANASLEEVPFGRAVVKRTGGNAIDKSARLPFAPTAQVDTVTPTAVNTTLYTLAIKENLNGELWQFSATSDGSATATEIVTLFKDLINAAAIPITASGTSTLVLTADVAGDGFTTLEADSNLAVALTTANVGLFFLGVAERIHSGVSVTAGGEAYRPMSAMTCLFSGEVWVEVEEAIAVGDPAYFRHSSGSATVVGKFRNDADSGTCKPVPRGVFMSSTTGAGLARLSLLGLG